MRRKVKYTSNNSKKQLLPLIKNSYISRTSPRVAQNNRSLPKTPALHLQLAQQNRNQINKYNLEGIRRPLKDKLKAVYQKKKNLQPSSCNEQSSICNDEDGRNITNNFQKQIEKNLIMIKRHKQSQRRLATQQKIRYNSSQSIQQSAELPVKRKRKRYTTNFQDEVFSNLTQIIAKSQNKTPLIEEKDYDSAASVINVKSQGHTRKNRQKIKTEAYGAQFQSKMQQIKHSQNYLQWRKLSIDSEDNCKMSYNISSYEIETDRLEKIRIKNELSLRKYFEGKSYLNKLVKYRDSSTLISQ